MTDMANTTTVAITEGASLTVDVQYALDESDQEEPPSQSQITQWAENAYSSINQTPNERREVTIRLVGENEMRHLNRQYRAKDNTTNVLSFPFEGEFESISELALGLLGDVVICHNVILSEAKQQNKSVYDHYAHMVTHGILHLSGYDHQDSQEAEAMEALEVEILAQSKIPNPYATNP